MDISLHKKNGIINLYGVIIGGAKVRSLFWLQKSIAQNPRIGQHEECKHSLAPGEEASPG